MSVRTKTLDDVLKLAPAGGRLVLCAPSQADAGRLLRATLDALGRPGTALIVSAETGGDNQGGEPHARRINLDDTRTLHQAVLRLRKEVAGARKNSWVVIDASTLPGRWAVSSRKRLEFYTSVAAALQKRSLRSVLIFCREDLDPREITVLKDQGDVFLLFSRIDRLLRGQILTARGLFAPGLFEPTLYSVDPSAPVSAPSTIPPVGEGPVRPADDILFDGAAVAMALLDLRGTYRRFNRQASSLLGYAAEDLENLTLSDVVPPQSLRSVLQLLALLRRKGKAEGEFDLRRRNGRIVRAAATASILANNVCLVILRDVTTAWKQERELLAAYTNAETLVDRLTYPSAVFVDRRLVSCNPAFRSTFPWLNPSSPRGVTLTQVVGRQHSAALQAIAGQEGADRVRLEAEVNRPDGTSTWFDISAVRVTHNGKAALHCIVVDATERRSLTQKLSDSVEYYRTLVEASADAVAVVQDGRFLFANKQLASMAGYATREELIGKEATLLWADISPFAPGTRHGRTSRPAGETLVEIAGQKKDGSKMITEVHAASTVIGGCPATLVSARDVTLRRQEQHAAALRQKGIETALDIEKTLGTLLDPAALLEAALRLIMKGMGAEVGGMFVVDERSPVLPLSGQQGMSEKLSGALSAQSTDEGITGYVLKTQEPLLLYLSDYPPYLPFRSLFEAEQLRLVLYLPLVADGTTHAVLMAARRRGGDPAPAFRSALEPLVHRLGLLLARAKGYATVRQAEERYRSAVESIADVIYQIAPTGVLQFISPNVERLLGYTPQEFIRSPDLWRMTLHPDDRPIYAQRISNQTLPSDDFHLEYRVLPKGKASYRWVRDSIRYRRGEQGTLLSINGIMSDISDRIDLEAALIKSEEMKTNVLESVQEGVMVLDPGFLCIDWNRSMEAMTGVTRGGVIGNSVFELVPFLSGEPVRRLLQRVLLGESLSTEDLPLAGTAGQEERFLWVRFSPLRDSGGTIRGVVGIVTDVSSRKRLEREVRESEETLRNVIDAMGDALMISDLQGKVWEVNREFSRVTGYSRTEVLGLLFPYPWVLDEEMARFVTWVAALREKNYLRDFDMTWRRKDGQTVAISLNTTMLRNAYGEPVAMLNIARDITDRRRLTTELERKNRQIELLNRIISKANSTMEFSEIFGTIAEEVGALTPFDRIRVFLISEDRQTLTLYACQSSIGEAIPAGSTFDIRGTVAQRVVEQGAPVIIHDQSGESGASVPLEEGIESQISVPFSLKDRVVGTFSIGSARPHAFTGEETAFLQPIADQIGVVVDRIRLFQKVSEDSKYIHNLVNSIDSVVFTVDHRYRITEANKAWRDFALEQGLERFADEAQVIGMSLEDLLGERISWSPYRDGMEGLFNRSLDVFSREVELKRPGADKTYHLSITPMVIDDRVTSLVFTLTDITEIKRTEEEVRQRNKELVALNTISASISTSLNLDEVLRVASEQIRDIVGADLVMVYLHERALDRLILSRSLGLSPEHAGRIRTLPTSASATGTVILEKKPLYLREGLVHDTRITGPGREVFSELGIASLGVIPLQSKEEVLGAVDVAFASAHEFPEQERQLLLLIGNQLGPAIENAQLYAEVQSQVQRITALYELGKRLTGTLDTRTLLHSVWAEAAKILPSDRFLYATFSETLHSLLTAYLVEGDREEYFGHDELREGTLVEPGSLFWDLITQGTSLRLDGTLRERPGESLLAVPVRSKDRVIGVLSVSKQGVRVFSDVHLRLLESIGNLTEIAIEKAHLYEDTIAKSAEIADRNKELDDFTYVVSHDLKEPLISIEGYSRILLKDYRDRVDEDGKEYLNSIVQSSGRMKNLIDDLLTLSRLGRVSETLGTVSSRLIVEEILHELRFTIEEKHVTFTVAPDMPDVRYNATQLSMVFRNLISNALKFNDKPGPSIAIGCERHRDHVVFTVADNGIGIEPQYYEKIFMIFQRLQRSEEYRGTGAGLTIVKKIVEKHRGRIWVESAPGKGTTFSFTVPTQG